MSRTVTVFTVVDESGVPLDFWQRMAEAKRDQKWWLDKGGIEPSIKAITVTMTKKGIVDLLKSWGDRS